jgi:cytochrome c-type biogenesis protein CcmH/NrfG
MHNVFGSLHRVTQAVTVAALIACTGNRGSGDAAASTGDPDAPAMSRGVDMLYRSSDPIGAEAVFREVLQRNPTHYGARYQLAVALDRGGKPAEARPVWDAVLKNAEAISDTSAVRAARARLLAPDTASQEAMMALGIDLVRRQNNPAAAAEQFRKVLQRNPTHYGATYQLAMTLDKSGQAAQARPLWQKVLGMATTYKDEPTAQAARQRLGANR